ncbi:MAG: hypothetical protein SWZ49_21640 [Cyanobacteriota bacterium]|nr:hypothetical protein [Cyanobacteriota bacterium]
MLDTKLVTIGLVGLSAGAIFLANPALGQNVEQEFNGRAIGPETSVSGSNLTINPSGRLRQLINCEARNDNVPLDPSCDASNTAIYDSRGNGHQKPPHNGHNGGHNGGHKKHGPSVKQKVENGGTNTTVIAPASSSSNSRSSSKSSSNSSSESNARATVRDSGNSRNTNLNFSQGGEGGKVRDSGNSRNTNLNVSEGGEGGKATTGDQKNKMSVNTGATSVSPSTKVKVDGDEYNSIVFGSQAPGTGGEAFSFNYRSACGTAVNYRQGFALKPRRIAGGGFGYALDVSTTKMDTIENRGSVQNKMNTAFETAMGVVNNQQAFEQRLNTGGVSRREAETHAIANCTPVYSKQEAVRITDSQPVIDKPRNCTARGCN